jgi:intracellular septation protein
MKILFDLFPVVLFFIAYKVYDIYVATAVIMAACLVQVAGYWLVKRRVEKVHFWTLIAVLVFGGATLILDNPDFIKWKPTIVNWGLGVVFLFSAYVGQNPLVKRMMQSALDMPLEKWRMLNHVWTVFFVLCGVVNLAVAFSFSENTWVNFKLFGLTGMSMVFLLAQVYFLREYVRPEEPAAEEADSG